MSAPGPPGVAVDLRALVGRPTGIGWFTLSLLTRLAERGAHRYLGLAHAPPFASRQLEAAGVALEHHPSLSGVWWQQLVLPPRLVGDDVDLFWSPLNILPLGLPVPAVVTLHDLTPILMPRTHRLKVRLSVLPFLRSTLAAAQRIVADSESTARDLRRRYPSCAGRLRVVYPGVDEAFRPSDAEAVASFREEIGCPEGYLLFAATLEPRKNLGLLLEVWRRLRASEPDFPPLVLCGGYGWASRDLLDRIRSLEPQGLRYLGHLPRPDLVRWFQAARAFVYPSLYEGFGLPAAEAMACGVPTVASSRASLPEVVGDAGLLFDPESAEELAMALARVVRDSSLAADLGARGRERAARFTRDAAAARMEEVFTEALAGAGQR